MYVEDFWGKLLVIYFLFKEIVPLNTTYPKVSYFGKLGECELYIKPSPVVVKTWEREKRFKAIVRD